MAKKVGEILIEGGLLTPQLVAQGLEAQKFYGGRVGSIWLDMGVLEEKELVEALCTQKHAQAVKAGQLKAVTKATLDLIPRRIAERYQVIPVQRENRRLTVAITDPNDLLALDELAFFTGCVIEPLLATERTIRLALEKYYGIERKRRDTVEVAGAKASATAARGVARAATAAAAGPAAAVPQGQVLEAETTQDLALDDAGRTDADAARRFWTQQQTSLDAASSRKAPGAPAPPAASPRVSSTTTLPPPPPSGHAGGGQASEEIVDGEAYLLDEGDSTQVVAESARTIEEASRRLAQVEIRDDIADVILWATEDLFRRSALFIFQKSRTLGWTGQGEGLTPNQVRKVVLPIEEVSIFTIARDVPRHYLGPLPKNPGDEKVVMTLGGTTPPAVLVIPFGVKGKPIGCFYAEDEMRELEEVDLHLMFRLLQKAGLALELLLIRSKLVML